MSNCCVLNKCCADCWSNCVRFLMSCPSLVDRLMSVVEGEIVAICVCDGVGEELCKAEAGDELLNTFKLISVVVDVVVVGA